ncbi:hypothetical protein AnigIFM63604_008164 [Aspergillus niger]|uniref:CFEM domain-containing protein n=2 Tax=Aspergillus TaxID=5052 RepID=A0A370Q0J0_ASPPH|nr:hypothetical protein M752DRAFT_331696 [Aspergillus phoenicis ATCC 13157]GKZ69859.1 hypothetical protein AnigIFM50267_005089 [Aspergillus niger]GLA11983.1 hypothetical protein AnigIFM62618_007116 [Aspergillus niger]GLA26117.1 hypothetical protein AnigIFM63326_002923 [Aspergillus niger]GLA34148.1 hypothetical protein AnigIFM63309_005568 [Aspergillus niger]
MKFSILLPLAAVLSFAAAQSIPDCLGNCVESSTVCDSGNIDCYCTNGSFQQGVRDCLNNNGCGDELQDGINLENAICGSS